MLFNSFHFLGFFIVTIIIGNILKSKTQRVFLLLASFYFYMAWNPYFISLLLVSIVIDYCAAIGMSSEGLTDNKRKLWLTLSLCMNLGLLGFFKYTNFFLGVANDTLNFGNWTAFRFSHYNIILPVGISFYTFQSMSYTIDVYRRVTEPRRSFLDFALYVSFFPQLVAGPIVRAETFFRDLNLRLSVTKEDIQVAFSRILIGFTRKVVFADNLGRVTDYTYLNYHTLSAFDIWVGAVAFCWQIYFDFAGYTDIAIGVARLFGFEFDANFNFPMVCNNIKDHWAKWHISFSTWIRDYIYFPLGGSRVSELMQYRNLFITWLFAGVWHGAAYHYICWGVWQGVMLLVHREYSMTSFSRFMNERGGKAYDIFSRVFTKFWLAFGFIMFRAEDMPKAWDMMKSLVFLTDHSRKMTFTNYQYGILLIICYIAAYIFHKNKVEKVALNGNGFAYIFLVTTFLLLVFGVTESQNFLYFAF